MAKVCEMIVNRDYIRRKQRRPSSARLIPRAVTSPPRARAAHTGWVGAGGGGSVTRARSRSCVRVCGRDAFTHVCGKKRPGGRTDGRAGGRAGGAGGRRYFFTRNERVQGETCIRLAAGGGGWGGGSECGRGDGRVRAGGCTGGASGEGGGTRGRSGGDGGQGTGDGVAEAAAAAVAAAMAAARGRAGRGGGGGGWSTLCRRFFGAFFFFFTGDGPRLPG